MSSYIPRKYFRFMRYEDLQNGEIRVPKEFVELHWKSVSNPVVFIFPNGATQKIYWVKRNGDIWFQKNWEKFAKFLKFRFKVNFEYIGGSYFKIEIYGVNTLEIDYSNIKFIDEVNGAENRNEVEEAIEVSDDSDKSLDESELPTQTQRTKNGKRKMAMDSNANHQNISGSNRGHMNKKAKKCSTSKANNGRDEEIEEVVLSDDIDESDIPKHEFSSRKRGGMIKERTSCGENPSFELQLSPSYAYGRCLRIPNDFSREHLKGFKGTVKIRVGKDKPMEVKLIIDTNGSSIITTGWNLFAEKYNLKYGDKCKFELTQSQPFSFTVAINPATNKPCRKRGGMIKERTRIISNKKERTRNYRSRDSMGGNMMKDFTFEILVKKNYPDLPKEFINISDDTYVELKMERKSWSVLVKHFHSFNGIRFGYGWRPFIKQCNLIGKVCCFELIDEEKFVFNVLVARKNHGVV